MLCLPLGVKGFHLPRLFSLFQSFHSAVQAKPRKTPTRHSAASACRSEQHNCCTSEATNHLRVKSKPFFRQLEGFFPPALPLPPLPPRDARRRNGCETWTAANAHIPDGLFAQRRSRRGKKEQKFHQMFVRWM